MTEPTLSEPGPGEVWILGLPGEEGEDRGRFFRRDDARIGRQPVPVERLQANVAEFVLAMGRAIETVPRSLAGFSVDSIEIGAEISASGKVSLLGNGGELAGTGGIKFRLTRAILAAGDTAG